MAQPPGTLRTHQVRRADAWRGRRARGAMGPTVEEPGMRPGENVLLPCTFV